MATEQRLIDLGAMFPKESLEEQIRRIINAPTVDAVPVVRCKDCKWRLQDEVGRNCCELIGCYVGETDYCSRGERRTDNG